VQIVGSINTNKDHLHGQKWNSTTIVLAARGSSTIHIYTQFIEQHNETYYTEQHIHNNKVKQSHYRPGQALRFPGCRWSQISKKSAHEGGKVVSPTHRPPLPPGNIPGTTHFCYRGWVNPRVTVRPEGLCQWKIPLTPSRIEPANLPVCRAVPQPTAPPGAPHT